MNIVKQYNNLHNKEVNRSVLKNLLAKSNHLEVTNRLTSILKNNPETDFFILNIENPVFENSLNAPRHKGLLKEALTECGRLKKGWKYKKGGGVEKVPVKNQKIKGYYKGITWKLLVSKNQYHILQYEGRNRETDIYWYKKRSEALNKLKDKEGFILVCVADTSIFRFFQRSKDYNISLLKKSKEKGLPDTYVITKKNTPKKGKTALFGLNGTYEVPKNPTVESTLKFAEENLFDKYVTNRDVGKKIKFTKNGIKKAIRGKRGISKIRLQLVYISKQMLQSARLVKTEKDKKNRKQIKNIYKLNASHIINGNRYNVYIVLRESLNGSIYYDHDAVKVKKDVKQTGDDSKKSNSTPLCKLTPKNKGKNKNQVNQAFKTSLNKPLKPEVYSVAEDYLSNKQTPKTTKPSNQKNNVTPLQKLGYVQASTAPKKAKNVFRLNGEIGNFIQDIQRHKELILIKGNKHSSKSQLAMQIANALGEKELLVAYIDYEQGGLASKDTIDSLNRNTTPEGKQNIFVKGFVENPMEELEELCINCDAIVADSITDLGISADEINYLRGKYEDVIWCFISQVKSNGEMYGGNKMAHNPTKIIHCTSDKDFTKRIATLEKNRGGDLTLLYNISEKKVFTDEVA